MCSKDLSLDAPVTEDGAILGEMVPSKVPNQEELVSKLEYEADRAARLESALLKLKPKEREVIEKRYLSESSKRLKEIGSELGVSKQRVAQIEQKAIEKLRKELSMHQCS